MTNKYVIERADKYFTKTKNIVNMFGESIVKYGIFIRRDIVVAPKLAIDFINQNAPNAKINLLHPEGTHLPSKTKIMEVEGPFSELVELETQVLQRLGVACVAAYNAYMMCLAQKNVPFLDMHGRHATGDDMMVSAAYGASVGSRSARMQGATGFVGTSNDLTAHFYGTTGGLGTMPHAAVGYAASLLESEWEDSLGSREPLNEEFKTAKDYSRKFGTLKSVQLYVAANPSDTNVTALVDYFGQEVTDSILVADWFYNTAKLHEKQGKNLSVRIDTHGGRFLEGLDYKTSVKVVGEWLRIPGADEYEIVRHILGNETYNFAGDQKIDEVRKLLFAQGVSAANIIHMRRSLSHAGFPQVKIVASSGFDLFKCQIFAMAQVPVDVIGTGSFLPKTLSETYATADIFMYNGHKSVKVGREFLYE